MKVMKTNLSMIRGDSESIKISLKNQEKESIPLVEGDTIYFTVKSSARADKKEIQKIVTEFVDGSAYIEIAPEDTNELAFKKYRYDIQLTTKDGTVKTIIPASDFIIEEEITHE